jgi:hypothetical protein
MGLVQYVTNTGDVSFFKLVEMISSQATLVDSQTPKKDTPRKANAAHKEGGRGRGSKGGRGSGRNSGQGHGRGGGRGRGFLDPSRPFIPEEKCNTLAGGEKRSFLNMTTNHKK